MQINTEQNVQLKNLTVPGRHRNLLRRMAAERMMANLSEIASGTSIATDALKKVAGETSREGGKESRQS